MTRISAWGRYLTPGEGRHWSPLQDEDAGRERSSSARGCCLLSWQGPTCLSLPGSRGVLCVAPLRAAPCCSEVAGMHRGGVARPPGLEEMVASLHGHVCLGLAVPGSWVPALCWAGDLQQL